MYSRGLAFRASSSTKSTTVLLQGKCSGFICEFCVRGLFRLLATGGDVFAGATRNSLGFVCTALYIVKLAFSWILSGNLVYLKGYMGPGLMCRLEPNFQLDNVVEGKLHFKESFLGVSVA